MGLRSMRVGPVEVRLPTEVPLAVGQRLELAAERFGAVDRSCALPARGKNDTTGGATK